MNRKLSRFVLVIPFLLTLPVFATRAVAEQAEGTGPRGVIPPRDVSSARPCA